MHYIVQENTFREENYDNLIAALDRMGLSYEVVKVRPFVEDYEFATDRKDVFVFGSLKMARLSRKYGWHPGSLMDARHDFRDYAPHYGENLLNHDSDVVRFADKVKWDAPVKFIRPCEDTKVFTGRLFTREEWEEFVPRELNNGHTTTLSPDTMIQVSSPKRIMKEIRFWVVGGRPVTASQYRLGDRYCLDSDVEEAAWEFCRRMIKVHQLASSFVMDVCLTDDGWKIVECGCINCAGFYRADMQRIVDAIESYYNPFKWVCTVEEEHEEWFLNVAASKGATIIQKDEAFTTLAGVTIYEYWIESGWDLYTELLYSEKMGNMEHWQE